ncbi:phosphatase PAP2 family protein [Atopomonas sediminilitoris]|uniref:phosphatase PAP2 family protein n=1 Tax=Atopomonas sediminilitoris TaxID=2919919 RepID=UPI001F4E0633|nr:phosphatase PAP2 family protein [Atopomonas sediminilitoris]MCJ8169389.1 phosphatase PAP2 family protein [Atopomonas sediminilitoris]
MRITTPLQPRWSFAGLLVCFVLAVLLLASWLFAPTHAVWESLDTQAFYLLNEPLAHYPAWAWVWAVGSVRVTDLAVAALMLLLVMRGDLFFPAAQVRLALIWLVMAMVLLLVLRTGFNQLVKALDWQHAGPSLQLTAVRLSEMFVGWEQWGLKDASKRSFPGDHASVLMLWGLFLARVARWPARIGLLLLVCVLMMPRLVAGAHWLSDNAVGGLFIALLSFTLSVHTPYVLRGALWLENRLQPLLAWLQRLPWVGNWAVLRQYQS